MKKLTIAAVLALSIALTGCTAENPIESFYIGTGAHQCYAAVGDSLMTAPRASEYLTQRAKRCLISPANLNIPP